MYGHEQDFMSKTHINAVKKNLSNIYLLPNGYSFLMSIQHRNFNVCENCHASIVFRICVIEIV